MGLLCMISYIVLYLALSEVSCFPVTFSTYNCPNIHSSNAHLVFDKICYEFVTNNKDYWTGARHDCNNRGGDLAVVKTGDVQYYLQTRLQSLNVGNNAFWIGLNDRQREGHFTWVDGSPMDYSHWAVHEGYGGLHLTQDCVQIHMGDHGLWHDRECHLWPNKFNYICQYPSVETVHVVTQPTTPAPKPTTTTPEPTTTTTTTQLPTTITTTTPSTTPTTITTTTPSTTPTTIPTTSSPTTTSSTALPTTTIEPFIPPNQESTTLQPNREYPSTTEQPNREYPSTTEQPNREYPSTTEQPNREYPSTTEQPNREYPSTTEQPNREYPSTTEQPNREYPSTTEQPNREYPSTTQQPNREYPSTTQQPNREYPSTTEQPNEETPVVIIGRKR